MGQDSPLCVLEVTACNSDVITWGIGLTGGGAGCRVDMFVICEPGTYQLQTGQGPLSVDPGCGSSHCELLNQTTLATLQVVRACPPGSESEH